MQMKFTIIMFLIVILGYDRLSAQGGVDVQYVPIDSVDSKFISREVKLDFLSRGASKSLRIGDTVRIVLEDRIVNLVENKGWGADYYYFRYEYLESEDYLPGFVLRIYTCVLKEMTNDSILFRLTLQIYGKGKKKDYERYQQDNRDIAIYNEGRYRYFRQIDSHTTDLWIGRNILNGLLIRTW